MPPLFDVNKNNFLRTARVNCPYFSSVISFKMRINTEESVLVGGTPLYTEDDGAHAHSG